MSQHDNASADSAGTGNAPRTASRAVCAFWYSVLVLFGLVSIWFPLFNKVEPRLWGIPFFLWFQFVWVFFSAVATALAYKMRA